jgi:hypothetical protein
MLIHKNSHIYINIKYKIFAAFRLYTYSVKYILCKIQRQDIMLLLTKNTCRSLPTSVCHIIDEYARDTRQYGIRVVFTPTFDYRMHLNDKIYSPWLFLPKCVVELWKHIYINADASIRFKYMPCLYKKYEEYDVSRLEFITKMLWIFGAFDVYKKMPQYMGIISIECIFVDFCNEYDLMLESKPPEYYGDSLPPFESTQKLMDTISEILKTPPARTKNYDKLVDVLNLNNAIKFKSIHGERHKMVHDMVEAMLPICKKHYEAIMKYHVSY